MRSQLESVRAAQAVYGASAPWDKPGRGYRTPPRPRPDFSTDSRRRGIVHRRARAWKSPRGRRTHCRHAPPVPCPAGDPHLDAALPRHSRRSRSPTRPAPAGRRRPGPPLRRTPAALVRGPPRRGPVRTARRGGPGIGRRRGGLRGASGGPRGRLDQPCRRLQNHARAGQGCGPGGSTGACR
ncbi:LigA [Luteococcus japonicus LSP_Lj1]|uniref:LigA n=1 Tax=Luteococcus japonicus LSP_Lj1 TaxID=1255658 RepID=A0A1R4K9C4_9ACTN|nr:LigA [Luteococcus japonicus LSP_Lj1]